MPRISKWVTIKNVRAWQNRRKSLLYWAFCRYVGGKSKVGAAQLQTLNPLQCEIGWA